MEKFSISDFTPGDLVTILGQEEYGKECWYGEVVDSIDKNTLLVCILEQTKEQGGKIWRFGSESEAPLQSIMTHVIPERPNRALTRRTMKKAWRKLGFVVGVDDYAKREDEDVVVLEMGSGDSSSECSTDEDDDYDPSEDTEEISSDEEFTMADSDDSFVEETHDIVEEFNSWEPRNKRERSFKSVIERIEEREMRKADERAFLRGSAAPNFRNPKRRRR